jgi:Protein of unknown function (DUF3306)
MSDQEFLARWSRLKREAKTSADAQPPATAAPNAASPGTTESSVGAEMDLSSLPSIESITGGTDITAFLRQGIPPQLCREALRRAWAADPAIRDFVGLAENAWDFNDPNAMPGFGPLDCSADQLAALLDRVLGAADRLAPAMTEPEDARQPAASAHQVDSDAPDAVAELTAARKTLTERLPATSAAAQPEAPAPTESDQVAVRPRSHGGALPR